MRLLNDARSTNAPVSACRGAVISRAVRRLSGRGTGRRHTSAGWRGTHRPIGMARSFLRLPTEVRPSAGAPELPNTMKRLVRVWCHRRGRDGRLLPGPAQAVPPGVPGGRG